MHSVKRVLFRVNFQYANSLSHFRGKAVIIVNVASECGLTNKNYTQLKPILDKYKEQGLAIAAFPCNQFGGQVCFSFLYYYLIFAFHTIFSLIMTQIYVNVLKSMFIKVKWYKF